MKCFKEEKIYSSTAHNKNNILREAWATSKAKLKNEGYCSTNYGQKYCIFNQQDHRGHYYTTLGVFFVLQNQFPTPNSRQYMHLNDIVRTVNMILLNTAS